MDKSNNATAKKSDNKEDETIKESKNHFFH